MDAPEGFPCKFCGKVFKLEHRFEKHRCKEMVRDEQLRSVQGQSAFNYFNLWLTLKKRARVTKKTFGTSRHFTCFFNFVEWKRRVKLPNTNQYIRLMVIWDFDPKMWTYDQVYSRYIQYVDSKSTVEDHILTTFTTIKQIANAANCERNEIFDVMEPYMVAEYVRARKLSPWVLIKIPGFRRMYKRLNDNQQITFNNIIRPKFWLDFIERNQEDTELVKQFVEKANL